MAIRSAALAGRPSAVCTMICRSVSPRQMRGRNGKRRVPGKTDQPGLATRAVDVVPGFVDLTPQRLPFFRREPALASAFRLAAVCTFRVLALLSTRIGLGRLLLRRIIARVAAGVALLRQPVCGAS